MELEEVFVQLRGEVARLRELCSEQGRLLRRLRARKGPVLDIPVSLPIQCTEDAVTGEGQRSPESHQSHRGALTSPNPNLEGTAHPMEQSQDPSRLSPSPGNAPTGVEKGDVPAWMRSWIFPEPQEGGRAPRSPREMEIPNPGAGGSFPNLLDLYETPEDAPREGALPAEAPVEIRGPVKTSWTPGWALEDGALGSSEAAPACELCREIFPADAAGHAEYLTHVLAHLE